MLERRGDKTVGGNLPIRRFGVYPYRNGRQKILITRSFLALILQSSRVRVNQEQTGHSGRFVCTSSDEGSSWLTAEDAKKGPNNRPRGACIMNSLETVLPPL